MMTTEVVPSPTSLSCNWESSTMILPAGCWTSSYFKMVAPIFGEFSEFEKFWFFLPSLVTVTSPISSTSILSRPYGPRDVFTMFAIALTAMPKGLMSFMRDLMAYSCCF